MIELGRHIEILLLNNDCVIVPNLGGFMAHHVEAHYDERDNMFIPPLRTLGFNPQLTMSDPLLAQSYADAYDVSYPEAVAMLEREVETVKTQIEQEGHYEFADLGMLRHDNDGRYEFEPNPSGLLTPTLYGLSSIELPLLAEALKHGQPASVTLESRQIVSSPTLHPSIQPSFATMMSKVSPSGHQPEEKTISIKVSLLRNLAVTAVAAVALLLFARPVTPGESTFAESQPAEASLLTTITPKKEVKEVVAKPAEASSIVGAFEELANHIKTLNTETVLPTAGHFTVVLGCSLPLENAQNFLASIHEKGARQAALFEYKNDHMVVYGDYADQSAAVAQLQALQADGIVSSGWVMEVK